MEVEPGLGVVPNQWARQGGVAGDGAAAVDDLADAVGRHGDLVGQLGGGDAEGGEFFGQAFARVDGWADGDLRIVQDFDVSGCAVARTLFFADAPRRQKWLHKRAQMQHLRASR